LISYLESIPYSYESDDYQQGASYEAAPFLKATKAFDPREMYSVIGCCADAGPNLVAEEWLRETRGLVELPHDKHANGN
jgi:hypothetical protein